MRGPDGPEVVVDAHAPHDDVIPALARLFIELAAVPEPELAAGGRNGQREKSK